MRFLSSAGFALVGVAGFTTATCQTVDQPLQVGGDVSAPVLIRQVEPKVSKRMRKIGEKAVLVHLVVDEQGVARKVRVLTRESDFLTSDPEFNESAVSAVEQYRFRPGMFQGKPVATELNVDMSFHLKPK